MVEEYIDVFEHLVVKIDNLTDDVFKQWFIDGLKKENKTPSGDE